MSLETGTVIIPKNKVLKCKNLDCEHPKDKIFTYSDFYETNLSNCKKCVLKRVLKRQAEQKELRGAKNKKPKDGLCSRKKGESHLDFAFRYNREHPTEFAFTSRARVLHDEAIFNKCDVTVYL